MTTRWIESAEPVVLLPVNPAEWTEEDVKAVLEVLNPAALQQVIEAALAAMQTQEVA
jgi:hypothetical protein